MEQCPLFVQNSWPWFLTHGAAVHTVVVNDLVDDIGHEIWELEHTDLCCNNLRCLPRFSKSSAPCFYFFIFIEDIVIDDQSQLTFELPDAIERAIIFAIMKSDELWTLMADAKRAISAAGNVVDFDTEWEPSMGGRDENPPAAIKFAAGTHVVVYRVLHGQRKVSNSLPVSLASLLVNGNLRNVGVGFGEDATKVEKFTSRL